MIIVTAGHVDHGKTSLLQALTGTNADRLPEEQRRGMTIDLGYAFMDLPQQQRLAFIDVPGHEKFINNMLCGVSHAQHALLVVACDDGVMPQTREHLQILTLMPLHTLTVVLTKCDRVNADRIEQLQQQLQHWLTDQPRLQHVQQQQFVVSAINGQGIGALTAHLQALAATNRNQRDRQQPFRMVIDRTFSVRGAGLVATGTVISGMVSSDDKLSVSCRSHQQHQQSVRVRGLHSQGRKTTIAYAGERVALNLSGQQLPIERGDWLSSMAQPQPLSRFTVAVSGFTPKHWQSVHLHHGADHQLARIALLSEQPLAQSNHYLAELVLDRPLLPAVGDMLVIRDACGRETLGGARVIELTVPTRGKRTPARLQHLQQLAACKQVTEALTVICQQQAVSLTTIAWSWQLQREQLLQQLASELVCRGDWLISRQRLEQLKTTLLSTIEQHHQSHPDELGLGRARLLRMCHSNLPSALVNQAIDEQLQAQQLTMTRGQLHLPRHAIALTDAEQSLWQQLQQLFEQSRTPLWTSDICQPLSLTPKQARALCYKLVQLGYLTALLKDRYILSDTQQQAASLILQHLEQAEALSTADFCRQMQMGRKAGIQLLEWFDRVGFTRRVYQANSRTLRDAELFDYLRPQAPHHTSTHCGHHASHSIGI